jgi:hypothetical protein
VRLREQQVNTARSKKNEIDPIKKLRKSIYIYRGADFRGVVKDKEPTQSKTSREVMVGHAQLKQVTENL